MKLLPRDPTPEMVEAGRRELLDAGGPTGAKQAADAYGAMYDAAPVHKLKRTDPPTEEGWYWAGNDGYLPEPVYVLFCADQAQFVGCAVGEEFGLSAWNDWYGPLTIPEVEE